MRSLRYVAVMIVSAGLVLAFAGSAFATPAGWSVSKLTSDTLGDRHARVAGDRVAWVNASPGGGVWTWTPTEAAHLISADEGVNSAPEVSSTGRVVWYGYTAAEGSVLRSWTLAGGRSDVATIAPGYEGTDNWPTISGDHVAWGNRPYGEPLAQVYDWEAGSSLATVSANLSGIAGPVVGGERIAWYGSSGPAYQVYTALRGEAPKQLSHHVNGVAYYPDTSDGRVVWCDQDEAGNWNAWTWKASDDTSMALGACDYADRPQVSGDRVVWRFKDIGGNWQIATWTPTDGARTLFPNANGKFNEQVSGDRIVWEEVIGGVDQIMTWEAGDAAPTQLTDDPHPHQYPQVSGDHVVWLGVSGSYFQVFSAIAEETPPPLIATSLSKASLSTSKPKKGKYVTFTSVIRPSGAAVGGKVTFKLWQQLRKSNGKKYWKLRKSVTVGGAASGKFSARILLKYKGAWKAEVVPVAVASGYLMPARPAAKTFTVK